MTGEPTHADQNLIEQLRASLDWWSSRDTSVTSSITGGGAVRALEDTMSRRHRGRPCLALPSGTQALRVALASVGVRPGDTVVCPAYDWPAATAAITSLGAAARYAPVDPATLTLDPSRVGDYLTTDTTAVVATHLFGIAADVPAIQARIGAVPVVEDCAQAFGAQLDGRPVGTLGSAAAFSFGPNKTINAQEAGAVVFADHDRWRAGVRVSQHPTRQLLAGIDAISLDQLQSRIHPAAAIQALHRLATVGPRLAILRRRRRALQARLEALPDVALAGCDARRLSNSDAIAIRCEIPLPNTHADITVTVAPASWMGHGTRPVVQLAVLSRGRQ